MKIVSTEEPSDKNIIICIQTENKTSQGQNFKHIRHRYGNRVGSMEQE